MDWISVDEEIPHEGETVLVCDQLNNFVTLGRVLEEDELNFYLMNIDQVEIDTIVTHWMPLPKPPID